MDKINQNSNFLFKKKYLKYKKKYLDLKDFAGGEVFSSSTAVLYTLIVVLVVLLLIKLCKEIVISYNSYIIIIYIIIN
jgi:hypothetical protein